MSVTEIEAAIKSLPKEALVEFDRWYQEYLEDQWDERIRGDIRAGKLDFLRAEVLGAEESGTLRRFP